MKLDMNRLLGSFNWLENIINSQKDRKILIVTEEIDKIYDFQKFLENKFSVKSPERFPTRWLTFKYPNNIEIMVVGEYNVDRIQGHRFDWVVIEETIPWDNTSIADVVYPSILASEDPEVLRIKFD